MAKELYYEQKHISDIICDDEKAAAVKWAEDVIAAMK